LLIVPTCVYDLTNAGFGSATENTEAFINRVAEVPLEFQPGEHYYLSIREGLMLVLETTANKGRTLPTLGYKDFFYSFIHFTKTLFTNRFESQTIAHL